MHLKMEEHSNLMQELLKGEIGEKRMSEIVDSLSNDKSTFENKIAETTKLNDQLMKSNTELRDSNAHWFNKVTSQSQSEEKQKEQEKEEAKKNQTLSDVLGGL